MWKLKHSKPYFIPSKYCHMLCSLCGGKAGSRHFHFLSASTAIITVFGSLRVEGHALLTALHNTSWEVRGHFESSPYVLYLHVFFSAVTNEYGGPNTAILHTWTRNLHNLPLAKHSESPCKPWGQVFHWEPLSLFFRPEQHYSSNREELWASNLLPATDWFHRYYHWRCVKIKRPEDSPVSSTNPLLGVSMIQKDKVSYTWE